VVVILKIQRIKFQEYCSKKGLDIQCIGIPKTVDNDLPLTDCSPGFGSVGKYTAISTLEAGLDVKSMCATSTKVFILEVMGRHAGWIAASSALASESKAKSTTRYSISRSNI
jgi:6-phosphofructokinase 1